jgi:hypothetical protein
VACVQEIDPAKHNLKHEHQHKTTDSFCCISVLQNTNKNTNAPEELRELSNTASHHPKIYSSQPTLKEAM